MKRKANVFRGIAAVLAFVLLASVTATTLTFQYSGIINTRLGFETTTIVADEDSEGTIFYANEYGYVVTLNYQNGDASEELASVTVQADGSESYTGDFGIISVNAFSGETVVKDTLYGKYTAKAVAVPEADDTEHKNSKGATYEFIKSGEVEASAFDYF